MIDDVEYVPVPVRHPMSYDAWQAILDALEGDATTRQREHAQDLMQCDAPRAWIDRAEERDNARAAR